MSVVDLESMFGSAVDHSAAWLVLVAISGLTGKYEHAVAFKLEALPSTPEAKQAVNDLVGLTAMDIEAACKTKRVALAKERVLFSATSDESPPSLGVPGGLRGRIN